MENQQLEHYHRGVSATPAREINLSQITVVLKRSVDGEGPAPNRQANHRPKQLQIS